MANKFTNIRTWVDYGGRQIKYFAEVHHSQLNESKVLSANSDFLLRDKVNQYSDRLEIKWAKRVEEEKKNRWGTNC